MNEFRGGYAAGKAPEGLRPPPETLTAPGVVRLSVNLAPSTARALRAFMAGRGISATEAVRFAIAILDLVVKNQDGGGKLYTRHGDSYREITIP